MNPELTKGVPIQNWVDLRLEWGEKEMKTIKKPNVDTRTLSQDEISLSACVCARTREYCSHVVVFLPLHVVFSQLDRNKRKHSESLVGV